MNTAVGTHLVIKIDRRLQKAKSIITLSGLIAAPQFEYMQYNLQYGDILSVGEGITNPEIKVGRKAIIHHLIESEDRYLIEENLLNGDQIRWLNSVSETYSYKLFGVIDEKGNIIPLPAFVFCEPEPPLGESMVYEEMMVRPGERVRFSTEQVGSILVAHLPEKKEVEKLFLRTVITHVAPGEKTLRPGLKILASDFTKYPISLMGKEYWIISREFVLSIITD